MDNDQLELTILMPCLNEEQTLKKCIRKAQAAIANLGINAEVLIADNGSSDNSIRIAESLGARVISETKSGYGAALMAGISAAQGTYILMADADDSYNFLEIEEFIISLRNGSDFVMGNRFAGVIEKGAMPFLHKYLGNPVLSFLGRKMFKTKIRDFHCGMRAFRKDKISLLGLQATGMEFATELVVKATFAKLRIFEVPVNLYRDGRNRPPHLRTWRDGWRHLRFMLALSPNLLFLLPGGILAAFGMILNLLSIIDSMPGFGSTFGIRTQALAACLVLIGFQVLWFSVLATIWLTENQILPVSPYFSKVSKFVKNQQIYLVWLGIGFGSLAVIVNEIVRWGTNQFGDLKDIGDFNIFISSTFLVCLSIQCFFSQFLANVISDVKVTHGQM